MTLVQFDNGYWYTDELKKFAETLGLPSAHKLCKDELEKTIRTFLKTGELKTAHQEEPVNFRYQRRRNWLAPRSSRGVLHQQ